MQRLLKYTAYLFFLPLWWLQLIIPRKKKVWVFGAWYGNRFSDNSKQLYTYIKENHPDIRAIWLTRDAAIAKRVVQEGGEAYLTNSLNGIYASLLAKNVIVSSGKRDVNYFFINGARWIQLWHGNPMKKIGLDDKFSSAHSFFQKKIVASFFPFAYEYNYHVVVSNAEIFTDKMASAFQVPREKVLETGCPRNDIFYSADKDPFNEHLREKFKDCKLAYYLPTFRNHHQSKSLFTLDDYNKEAVELFLKKENIVLVSKGHYVDNNLDAATEEPTSRIINLSDENVSDINFMLKDADLLITDYSGAYFDFLLTEKPLIFAAFDLEDYQSSSREMYFNYETSVAGPIAKNWKELLQSLQTIWNNDNFVTLVKEKNTIFNKYHDANNSKRVYELLKSS